MEGCKKLGVVVISIDAQDFLDKDRTLMLGVMWQLVATLALQSVNVKNCDLDVSETDEELKGRDLLLKWFNQHLLKAGRPTVKNFGAELKDSKSLLYVLNDLKPNKCSLAGV